MRKPKAGKRESLGESVDRSSRIGVEGINVWDYYNGTTGAGVVGDCQNDHRSRPGFASKPRLDLSR